MLHLLRNGRVYLWSPALPAVAGIVSEGIVQWHGPTESPTASTPPAWRRQSAASTTVLPEAAAAESFADARLLMGRGDPRTRRGKVSAATIMSCRPAFLLAAWCTCPASVTLPLRGGFADSQIFKGSYGKVTP